MRPDGLRHGVQALADLFFVRAHERTQLVFVIGDFRRCIAECTAAAAVGQGDFQLCFKQGLDLAAGIARISSHDSVPPIPILTFLLAKIGGHQRVLGREAAVEAHLVGTGFRGDLVDTDTVNAMAIEELAGGLKDTIPYPRLGARGRSARARGRSARARELAASAYA